MGKVCTKHRTDGSPCSAYCVDGSDACWFHGSGTPRAIQRRHTDKVVAAAKELAQTLGGSSYTTPEQFILDELYRTNGHILWLQERILCDAPNDVAESFWKYKRAGVSGVSSKEISELKSFAGMWFEVYQKERTHGVKTAETAARMGIQDRIVKLAERQVDFFARMLEKFVEDLGKDKDDPEVRELMGRRLLSLAEMPEEEIA